MFYSSSDYYKLNIVPVDSAAGPGPLHVADKRKSAITLEGAYLYPMDLNTLSNV